MYLKKREREKRNYNHHIQCALLSFCCFSNIYHAVVAWIFFFFFLTREGAGGFMWKPSWSLVLRMYPCAVKWCLTRRNLLRTTEKKKRKAWGRKNQTISERRGRTAPHPTSASPTKSPGVKNSTFEPPKWAQQDAFTLTGCSCSLLICSFSEVELNSVSWSPMNSAKLPAFGSEEFDRRSGGQTPKCRWAGLLLNDVSHWPELWFRHRLNRVRRSGSERYLSLLSVELRNSPPNTGPPPPSPPHHHHRLCGRSCGFRWNRQPAKRKKKKRIVSGFTPRPAALEGCLPVWRGFTVYWHFYRFVQVIMICLSLRQIFPYISLLIFFSFFYLGLGSFKIKAQKVISLTMLGTDSSKFFWPPLDLCPACGPWPIISAVITLVEIKCHNKKKKGKI